MRQPGTPAEVRELMRGAGPMVAWSGSVDRYVEKSGPWGRVIWRRFATRQTYHCDRCDRPHTSPVVALLHRPGTAVIDTLCNGCYGTLLTEIGKTPCGTRR